MKNKFLLTILLMFALIVPAFADNEDDATVLYNKGIDFYEQDKVNEAIDTFKKAIALSPDFYEAYYNLARIQEAAGKYNDAISTYEKLLTIQSDDYDSIYQFGELLYKRGYLSKAQSYLSKIPEGNEYKSKADLLKAKISKRQNELALESQIKAAQNLKSTTIGNVQAPSGLLVDSQGNIFVASFSDNTIYKFTKEGQKSVYLNAKNNISGPIGLAIDSSDNIYIANYNKGNVMVANKNGETSVLMYAKKPYCVSVDMNKQKLYITEQQTNSVLSYDISEILKKSQIQPQKEKKELPVTRFQTEEKREAPLGTPSIIESNFTKTSPQSSIVAPIMVPSGNLF